MPGVTINLLHPEHQGPFEVIEGFWENSIGPIEQQDKAIEVAKRRLLGSRHLSVSIVLKRMPEGSPPEWPTTATLPKHGV